MNDEHDHAQDIGEQDNGLSDLSNVERERLAALPREMNPPAELETAVASELRRQGLIGTRRARTWSWPGAAWVAAPAMATLALGFLIGVSWVQEAAEPIQELPRYILILRSGAQYQAEAPGEARGMEYADWAVNKLPRGAFLSGEELNETGWELRRAGETVQSNLLEAGAELGGQVAGFFLIQAKDDDDAVDLASTTPHLKYGGTVEVRPVAVRPRE